MDRRFRSRRLVGEDVGWIFGVTHKYIYARICTAHLNIAKNGWHVSGNGEIGALRLWAEYLLWAVV